MRTILAIVLVAITTGSLDAQERPNRATRQGSPDSRAAPDQLIRPAEQGMTLDPTPPARGPAPTALAATGLPSTATITWTAPAGAVGFDIHRSEPAGRWTQLNPSPVTVTRFDDRTGFAAGQSYVYRVVSHFASGPSGYADVSFQPPPPVNPSWVKAVVHGADVVVSWAEVPGATRYVVAGADGSMFRDVPAPATTVTYRGLAAGGYDIAVGARFDPGPVETPAAAWPRATVTVAANSGRYRIVLNGARVVTPTRDDMISRDGKGDEVYFWGLVEVFDRGSPTTKRKHRLDVPNLGGSYSPLARAIYGDVSGGFSSRIRAGSLSPHGGLGAGDVIPQGANIAAPYAPPQTAMLPMVMWEGVLTDGREALLVHPAVIEHDGASGSSEAFPSSKCPPDQLFNTPAVQQELARSGIGAPIVEPIRHPFTQCQRPLEMNFADAIAGIAVDRQVGPIAGTNDPKAHISTDAYVVLTREKIEATLGGRPWTTLRVDRVDRFIGGDGRYALYLLVERLP